MNKPDFSNINLNLDAPKISKEEWQAKVEVVTGKKLDEIGRAHV